jgi:D-sedoheptulose 7-phosphate isomerase
MTNITRIIDDHGEAVGQLYEQADEIEKMGQELIRALLVRKCPLLVAGNGGSAADAQHFVAELVGRFEKDRRPLSAISLTTNPSVMTSISNDYDYSLSVARQVEAHWNENPALLLISTSGNSENLISAQETAIENKLITFALLGREGGYLASQVDHALTIPGDNTARIQEMHILVLHIWAKMIEDAM